MSFSDKPDRVEARGVDKGSPRRLRTVVAQLLPLVAADAKAAVAVRVAVPVVAADAAVVAAGVAIMLLRLCRLPDGPTARFA